LISWDETKNQLNQQKHGIGFEIAQLVFNDPLHLSRQDRVENGEQRWQTVGMVDDIILLLVAHTWFETKDNSEHIRIISARRATKLEKAIYEKII
jgi:uncharacterized DUF497 family protein